jgi:hypothetical protein
MPTLEEITAWPDDQVLAELRTLIPKELDLDYGWDPVKGYWCLTLSQLNEKGEKIVVLEELNMDGRLALLNVYGQYWLTSSPPKDSPWVRRHGELSREYITKKVNLAGTEVPDPDDLDPAKINEMLNKQET